MRRRSWRLYLFLAALTVAAGLSTRKLRAVISPYWAGNLGDALWAVLVYLLWGILLPSARPRVVAALAATTATLVELSQLYRAPWIDAIRRTTLGGLVLGYDFVAGDLVCYYAGVALCLLCEAWLWGGTTAAARRPASNSTAGSSRSS